MPLSAAILLTALSTAMTTAPSFAQAVKVPHLRLTLATNLCADTRASMIDWARTAGANSAFAAPTAPFGAAFTCDNPGPAVHGGQTLNAPSVAVAEATAVAFRNAHKPQGYGNCRVLARTIEK